MTTARTRIEPTGDSLFWLMVRAIADDDAREAAKLIRSSPSLVRQHLTIGATRDRAADFYLNEIRHYVYAGDTPLHVAAAGYRLEIARKLITSGANVRATNRRGAEPLHYAADGSPGSPVWNPGAQAGMIALLVNAGAEPNAFDKSGVAPLHRAARQRCASAVDALLRNGAGVRLRNKSGSTPLHLAVQNTGRGGSGSPESKALQKEIIGLLLKAGADARDRDGRGKTVLQSIQSDWIRSLF